jgi:uncharacterized repeat protein (TIGR03803 family)
MTQIFGRRNRIMNNAKSLTLRVSTVCIGIALGTLVILSLAGVVRTVRAQNAPTEEVVLNFTSALGFAPSGVIYSAGNLYVGTGAGGTNLACGGGCGNILEVTPSGQSTELYAFKPGSDFAGPGPSGLLRDPNGTIYAATIQGGNSSTGFAGQIIRLISSGAERTIYNFTGGNDGKFPSPGLTQDSAGNLYGTTVEGGGTGCGGYGCGIVYKVTPSGSETILHSFTGGTDGAEPNASPILDSAGNLYGTAIEGGNLCSINPGGTGCGTVWKIDTSGNFTVLYSFMGSTDGWYPEAGLVMDSSGNLYGDAGGGGNLSCDAPYGCGSVFEIASSGNFSVLHSFTGGTDGQGPEGALVRDSAGNLYGTTSTGGDESCDLFGLSGCGVVYKVSSTGNETILHAFAGGTTDGALPEFYPLTMNGKGELYSTTQFGGSTNVGVIFAVKQ